MSKIKTYEIKKGKHYPTGLHIGLTRKDTIKFRAKFDSNCLYQLDGVDAYDINKLFGFSTTWNHHRQSARVGWRCLDGKEIEILTYSYNNSVRYVEEEDIIGIVKPDEWFECEISDEENCYYYYLSKFDENGNLLYRNTAYDIKQKDWFFFHYLLFPYFGGNNAAPHDMTIYIEKL